MQYGKGRDNSYIAYAIAAVVLFAALAVLFGSSFSGINSGEKDSPSSNEAPIYTQKESGSLLFTGLSNEEAGLKRSAAHNGRMYISNKDLYYFIDEGNGIMSTVVPTSDSSIENTNIQLSIYQNEQGEYELKAVGGDIYKLTVFDREGISLLGQEDIERGINVIRSQQEPSYVKVQWRK